MKRRTKTQVDEMAIIENTRRVLRTIAATHQNSPCSHCRELADTCGTLANGMTHLLKARGPERTAMDLAELPPWHLA